MHPLSVKLFSHLHRRALEVNFSKITFHRRNYSTLPGQFSSSYRRPVLHFRKLASACQFSLNTSALNSAASDEDINDILQGNQHFGFSDRLFRTPDQPHNVLVVQPYFRDPAKRNLNTTPELQLEESIALINSLPGWRVVDSQLVPLINFKKRDIFGSTTMERLKQIVQRNKEISAVFVSVNIFRVRQLIELETQFEVPCYDRYTIVIQIFRNHAVTKEAKLQLSMAEIPYLKQCVKGLPKGFSDRLGSADLVGGNGRTFEETRRELLSSLEKKLKEEIGQLRNHRERLRSAGSKGGFPVIAVVGYTNAGKTSLIKSLTGEAKLLPRDQLFATLDVTKHAGILPCKLKVLYVDTVGFISDIPSSLIESFTATLEDAIHSDIVIHVWDVSHPDSANQREHVWRTLKGLKLNEDTLGRVLEVGNKVDKLSEKEQFQMKKNEQNMIFISAKTGFGMPDLLHAVEYSVLKATGRFRMVFRVRTGEKEFDWLQKEVAVENLSVDEKNPEFCLMSVVMTKAQLEIFKNNFI